MRLVLSGAAIASLLFTSAAAAEGRIVRYLSSPMHVFDSNNVEVSAKHLPPTPVDINKSGPDGTLGVIGTDGVQYFVYPMEVISTGVRAPCKPVEIASRASGTQVTGTKAGNGSSSDCQM